MKINVSRHSRALRTACALALGAGLALPALAQVDLQFSSSTVPQPWYLGDTHTITFTVTNNGTTANVGGATETVHFSIPLETSITSALPAGCTGGPQLVDCELPAIAPGASSTFTFDLQGIATYLPPGNGLDLRFRADPTYDPTGGTTPAPQAQQFFGTPLPFFIIDRPVAVPTLDLMGLGLLGAAVGVMGMRRRRQKTQA